MSPTFEQRLQAVWYEGREPALWMSGLSLFYRGFLSLKDLAYTLGLRRVQNAGVPVIVVGNITVGGTGKTPLVLRLVELLRTAGYHPGVVSRGYGSNAGSGPCTVVSDSSAAEVGDEPLLIHRRGAVPVMVGSNRNASIRRLLAEHEVDVIISDDGLQHSKMGRDIEIVVIDGDRRLGNGRCLPAGPLREPESRLERVDFTLINGGNETELSMQLTGQTLVNLQDGNQCPIKDFAGKRINAVAAIGNPARFFQQLETAGIIVDRHTFPDHHAYTQSDLGDLENQAVIMTEKDAVKCREFAGSNWWVLPVEAVLPASFETEFLGKLERLGQ